MAFPYKSVSTNIDSLNSASFYEQADLDNVVSSSIVDKYFGTSEQDVIEFSVFDIDGNLQTWQTLPTTPVYNVITKTYKDVDSNVLTYNYKQYNSGYAIAYNSNMLLDGLTNLSASGIIDGNSVVSYNPVRNIGGTPDYELIIKSISVSRKELQLIPTFKPDETNEINTLVNLELSAFAQKKFLIRDIIPTLINQLSAYQIYSIANTLIADNKTTFDLMRTTFGFQSNIDVINFLNDIYTGFTKPIQGNDNQVVFDVFDGILGYLKNWLYTYYKNIESADDLQTKFQYIVHRATEIRLNKLNSYYGINDVTKNVVTNFITQIFYDSFIKNAINKIKDDYNNKFLGYLQNALNFGNNEILPILNYVGYVDNGVINIVVKLFDYLPQTISLRDRCWISNISLKPILQKVVLNAPVVKKRYKISGPNFNVKLNDYTSKPVNYQSSADLQLDANTTTNIEFYKKLTELNVDYNSFSNFIVFSSAELRTKLFLNKRIKINQLNDQLIAYTSASVSATPALSMSYAVDSGLIQNQINTIKTSFDGYEAYLNQQSFITGSLNNADLTAYISSAIDYDGGNKDSLVNNTPNYLITDQDNSDYLIFLSMIGHMFDNLYLYFNKFPTLQYVDSTPIDNTNILASSGSSIYLSSFANVLLEQFGWKPISSFDSSDISSTYLSGSNSVSNNQKLKTIWNRILQNLPILYKTKGTEECVRLMANIYGIPHNLLNVKEFGGNNIATEDHSSYTFDQRYYLTKFQGNNEEIIFPTSTPCRSIEFKFRIDPNTVYPQNKPISIMRDWALGWEIFVQKSVQDKMGTIKCDFSGVTDVLTITNIPIFNGRVYNVLLKLVDTGNEFDPDGAYPQLFVFRVTSTEDNRIVYDETRNILLDTNVAGLFFTGSKAVMGNYYTSSHFVGNIDKINVWKTELSDTAFLDHCFNFDAYNNYNPSSSYQDLYFRYGVEYPINLYTSSGYVNVANGNPYYSQLTASAVGFSPNTTTTINCVQTSASAFPYQYDVVDVRQNIQLDNAGPNKYKNSKINYVTEKVVSRLMPVERSVVSNTVTQDSNVIGVYVSPFKIRDDDMTNFIGNYNLMNYIGDPSQLYSSSYDDLRQLRDFYNTNNLSEGVLYQEFMTLYKHYFDGSFFTTVRQLFPARAQIIDGIIIEPTILERNKYHNKPMRSFVANTFDGSVNNKVNAMSASNVSMLSNSASTHVPKNGNTTNTKLNNYISNYISDGHIIDRNSIFSINGVYIGRNSTGSLTTYVEYKTTKPQYLTAIDSAATKSLVSFNRRESGSNDLLQYTVDTEAYPSGHLSLKPNPGSRFALNQFAVNSISFSAFIKSQQTIYTTVNDTGIEDGSSPVTITLANSDINQISLTTS